MIKTNKIKFIQTYKHKNLWNQIFCILWSKSNRCSKKISSQRLMLQEITNVYVPLFEFISREIS